MGFKQKVFCGGNIEKWGLVGGQPRSKLMLTIKRVLCQGRRKAPKHGRTVLTVITWCSINSFWYFLPFTTLSLGLHFEYEVKHRLPWDDFAWYEGSKGRQFSEPDLI